MSLDSRLSAAIAGLGSFIATAPDFIARQNAARREDAILQAEKEATPQNSNAIAIIINDENVRNGASTPSSSDDSKAPLLEQEEELTFDKAGAFYDEMINNYEVNAIIAFLGDLANVISRGDRDETFIFFSSFLVLFFGLDSAFALVMAMSLAIGTRVALADLHVYQKGIRATLTDMELKIKLQKTHDELELIDSKQEDGVIQPPRGPVSQFWHSNVAPLFMTTYNFSVRDMVHTQEKIEIEAMQKAQSTTNHKSVAPQAPRVEELPVDDQPQEFQPAF